MEPLEARVALDHLLVPVPGLAAVAVALLVVLGVVDVPLQGRKVVRQLVPGFDHVLRHRRLLLDHLFQPDFLDERRLVFRVLVNHEVTLLLAVARVRVHHHFEDRGRVLGLLLFHNIVRLPQPLDVAVGAPFLGAVSEPDQTLLHVRIDLDHDTKGQDSLPCADQHVLTFHEEFPGRSGQGQRRGRGRIRERRQPGGIRRDVVGNLEHLRIKKKMGLINYIIPYKERNA